ncbi:MAG: hypothetical protein WCR04_04675 [Fibrobacteraceae bacterium]
MNQTCPFCKSEIKKVDLSHLDLRICPHCLAAFFPSDKTMSFRREVFDKTRELWLKALETRKEDWVSPPADLKCIDHGEALKTGNLPDYGIPAHITACCGMFHLHAELLAQILRRTLKNPTDNLLVSTRSKHHFAFIVFLDRLLNKILGQKPAVEDPLELIQFNLKFKDILTKPEA